MSLVDWSLFRLRSIRDDVWVASSFNRSAYAENFRMHKLFTISMIITQAKWLKCHQVTPFESKICNQMKIDYDFFSILMACHTNNYQNHKHKYTSKLLLSVYTLSLSLSLSRRVVEARTKINEKINCQNERIADVK